RRGGVLFKRGHGLRLVVVVDLEGGLRDSGHGIAVAVGNDNVSKDDAGSGVEGVGGLLVVGGGPRKRKGCREQSAQGNGEGAESQEHGSQPFARAASPRLLFIRAAARRSRDENEIRRGSVP